MNSFLISILIFLTSIQYQQPQYSVLVPGTSWSYKTPDGTFDDYIHEQMFVRGKNSYFQNIRKYSDGTAEISYYRIQNGAVYYLDNKSFKESIEIPASPRKSQEWNSSDHQWEYKVVEVNVELKTPAHTFKNCIAINAKSNVDGSTFINYYSKGIGFVASKMNNELVTYLTKWQPVEKKS